MNYPLIILSLMVALLLLIILLERKYWLLLVFLIISIFLNYVLGLKIFGLPLTTQKIGMIVALLLLFPKLLSEKEPLSQIKNNLTFPVLILTIIAFLSFLRSNYPENSLQGLVTISLIFCAIHIIYYLIVVSNPERIKQTLSYGLISILIIFFSIAIINFIKGGELIFRLRGTIRNPNAYGAMALMALPVVLAGIEEGDIKLVWMGGFCGVLALLTIFLTYSRATYLTAFVFITVILIGNSIVHFNNKRFSLNKKVLLGTFLLVITGFLIYRVIPERFFEHGIERYQSIFAGGQLNLGDSSITKRYNAIWVAIRFFKENPLLGIGVKSFESHTSFLFGYWGGLATENTYLNVLSEMGLLGFSIFLFIIYRIFKTLIENHYTLKVTYLKCLNKYLTYGFITFLFLMFTNDFLTNLETFWIWAIITISLKTLDDRLIMYSGESKEKLT